MAIYWGGTSPLAYNTSLTDYTKHLSNGYTLPKAAQPWDNPYSSALRTPSPNAKYLIPQTSEQTLSNTVASTANNATQRIGYWNGQQINFGSLPEGTQLVGAGDALMQSYQLKNLPGFDQAKWSAMGADGWKPSIIKEGGFLGFGGNYVNNMDAATLANWNNATNGAFGALPIEQRAALMNNQDFVRQMSQAQTVGQADQIFKGHLNNLNAGKWTRGDTFTAIGTGIQAASALYGMYNAQQQMKLAREAFNEQKAFNRANFRNQAKAMNAQYRDQHSGRGYVGMGSGARSSLGRNLRERLVAEDY